MTTIAALTTVGIFALLQWRGVQSQAKAMEWMTYGAIVALVWFWLACIPGIDIERLWTKLSGHFEMNELYEVSFSDRTIR